ncbi:MAG: hypothetical protein IPM76_10445 [Chloroflexi bacterium]|nr:hypothetical protein [Chloroflexota bacterium]
MTLVLLEERPSPLSQLVLLFRRRRWPVERPFGVTLVRLEERPLLPPQLVLPFRRRR